MGNGPTSVGLDLRSVVLATKPGLPGSPSPAWNPRPAEAAHEFPAKFFPLPREQAARVGAPPRHQVEMVKCCSQRQVSCHTDLNEVGTPCRASKCINKARRWVSTTGGDPPKSRQGVLASGIQLRQATTRLGEGSIEDGPGSEQIFLGHLPIGSGADQMNPGRFIRKLSRHPGDCCAINQAADQCLTGVLAVGERHGAICGGHYNASAGNPTMAVLSRRVSQIESGDRHPTAFPPQQRPRRKIPLKSPSSLDFGGRQYKSSPARHRGDNRG